MKQLKRTVSPDKPKIKLNAGSDYFYVKSIVEKNNLHTICKSGNCPNISECWGNRTATFMILGNICTRGCKFCSVPTGKPLEPETSEISKVARSVSLMRLKSCVITSVDRDDLPDYGANHWAFVIREVKNVNHETKIEVLVPDFKGETQLLDIIINEQPDIISHNLETVKRLSPVVRPAASYQTSLDVIQYIAQNGIRAKSGIMVGLGETIDEIKETLIDLRKYSCSILTIGQYLQPSSDCIPVKKFYSDDEFALLKSMALELGFDMVESGKLVRSSYHAEKHVL